MGWEHALDNYFDFLVVAIFFRSFRTFAAARDAFLARADLSSGVTVARLF